MMKVMIVRERKGNREQVQNVAVKCAVVIATALVISIYLYAHHYHPYLPRDLPQDELDVINYLEYQRPFTPAEITSASLKHSIELARDTQGIAAVMLNWYVPFVFLLTLIYPPLPLLPAYLPDCLWMAATLRFGRLKVVWYQLRGPPPLPPPPYHRPLSTWHMSMVYFYIAPSSLYGHLVWH